MNYTREQIEDIAHGDIAMDDEMRSIIHQLLAENDALREDADIGAVAKRAINELSDSPISFMKTISRQIDAARKKG